MKKIPIVIIYHQNEPTSFIQSLLIQTEYANSIVITTNKNTEIRHELLNILELTSKHTQDQMQTQCVCCQETSELITTLRHLFLNSVKHHVEFDQILLEITSDLHLDHIRHQIEHDHFVQNYFEIINIIQTN